MLVSAQGQWLDKFGAFCPVTVELTPVTIVHDRQRNTQIMRIKGLVTPPIGTEIELAEPNVTVTVVGVRLQAGYEGLPVTVCLDVEMPAAFWTAVLGDEEGA